MLNYSLLRSFVNILSLNVLLVACQTNNPSKAVDYVTSLKDKLQLLEQNGKLLLNNYEYIEELQAKVETLRKLVKHLQQPQLAAKGEEKEFLSNPMNSLSLIRQMYSDWTHVEKLMEQPVGQKQLDYIRRMNERRPNQENVEQAMVAMHRIASSYELNAADIASGLLDGLHTDAKLSPLECYEMGLLYYNGSLYYGSIEWLETAKELMDKAPSDVYNILGLTRSDISHLLARCYIALDKLELARKVLLAEPDLSSKTEQLLEYFQENKPEEVENDNLIAFHEKTAQLCGSSYKPKPTRLLCSYKTSGKPFLRLAPFQMEQISEDPDIFVFHNVISSMEISILERETEAFMLPARVLDNGKSVLSNIRTVSSVGLPNKNFSRQLNSLTTRIRRRVSDLSDLKDSYYYLSEVLKYGFGGHYGFHNDFLNSSVFTDDRVATVLLYLNHVPSGGGTIFTQLNLTVQPEPGKAVLWQNLEAETFDFETRNEHASCPVKIGTKFAMTQWIHEREQMFTRPCLKPPKARVYPDKL